MLGREAEYLTLLERAHRAHVDADDPLAAFRCAFWIGTTHAQKGEAARAGGWLSRAQRLLSNGEHDQLEHGYLLLPAVFGHMARGDPDAAADAAAGAAAIGARFDDADLFALAAQLQGLVLIRRGELAAGLSLLDEAMVTVTAGEVSPIPAGIVYCGVILACQEAHEVGRAAEWTRALSDWCARQPDLVAFTGRCLVHRAEIMELRGEWTDGLAESLRAQERSAQAENTVAAGEAWYRHGELRRLRGEGDAAEEAYREASRCGREPQPGLALLRLAQGNSTAAAAAIRRALAETGDPSRRVGLLRAAVEILLECSAEEEAHAACEELGRLATVGRAAMLDAIAETARGAVALRAGEPLEALAHLRRACEHWGALDAPYEAARTRAMVGEACLALGDADAGQLERDAARETFQALHAVADLRALQPDGGREDERVLSAREREVLRLVSTGHSNRRIGPVTGRIVGTVVDDVQRPVVALGDRLGDPQAVGLVLAAPYEVGRDRDPRELCFGNARKTDPSHESAHRLGLR